MNIERCANFAEIKELFAAGDDNVSKYKEYYKQAYDKDTTLSDDDIIDVVAMSDDDAEPEGWALQMKNYEAKLTA